MNIINIAIYSRKSGNTTAGESIANQVELCKEYAIRQFGTATTFAIYEDEGFSGGNVDRPMFQKFMRDSKHTIFYALICYRLDRISRNVSDFSNILDYLQEHNINFISLRESFDTSTPMGRAMIHIASVFAQLERETIAERVRDNKYNLARDGRWQGGNPPVGYTAQKVRTEDHKSYFVLRQNPSEMPFVQMLFEQYQKMGSLTQLEIYMLQNKILTPMGNEISKAVLRQTLSNPTYAVNDACVYNFLKEQSWDVAGERTEFDGNFGLMGYCKTEQYGKDMKRRRLSRDKWIFAISRHKGIISGETWVAVQRKLLGNSLPPRADTSHVSLLSTLIRCGKCDAPMVVMGQRSNKYGEKCFYYACSRKRRSNGVLCDMKNIKGNDYDRALITSLKNYCNNDGYTSSNLSKDFKKAQKTDINNQDEIENLQKKISANDNAAKRLLLNVAVNSDNDDLSEYLQGAILDFSKKNSLLKQQIAVLLQNQAVNDVRILNSEIIKQTINDFTATFDYSDIIEQRRLIKNLVRGIIWDGKSSQIALLWDQVIYN